MLLLTSEVRIDNSIKIGFIFLDPKGGNSDDILLRLHKSREALENVIWSEPIVIRFGEGKFIDIVK